MTRVSYPPEIHRFTALTRGGRFRPGGRGGVMGFRLVAAIDGREIRIGLPRGEHVLGSHASAALRIDHQSVSRRHALIRVENDTVIVEDVGSTNGTKVGGRRIEKAELRAWDAVVFGAVHARLEPIPDGDLDVAVSLDWGELAASPVGVDISTGLPGRSEALLLHRLPSIAQRLAGGSDPTAVGQLIGEALFAALPCSEVTVALATRDGDGILFRADRGARGEPAFPVVLEYAGLVTTVTFPAEQLASLHRRSVESLASLLTVVRSPDPKRGRPRAAAPPALPDPPSVVPAVRAVYAAAARVARGSVSVLVLGESGTGKEVLARYIHRASPQADGPFLDLNCASLPRDLLEAELFGIERGVATGVEARPGKFELADGGTLLLDEVGDMAAETQAKILRVLQTGEVYRLGSREARPTRARIIAATNRDIRAMLAEGTFRSDLFHRLAGWVVEMLALRHRRADIPNLAAYFLARSAATLQLRVAGISRAAMDALIAYPWPGNVRQLENEMSRAALFLEDSELLDTSRLDPEIREARRSGGSALTEILERVERDEIILALDAASGNVEEAAARLGVSRATLYRRIRVLGIPLRDGERASD